MCKVRCWRWLFGNENKISLVAHRRHLPLTNRSVGAPPGRVAQGVALVARGGDEREGSVRVVLAVLPVFLARGVARLAAGGHLRARGETPGVRPDTNILYLDTQNIGYLDTPNITESSETSCLRSRTTFGQEHLPEDTPLPRALMEAYSLRGGILSILIH